MPPLLIDHRCRSSRQVALLRQAAFLSKVVYLLTVEAWKVDAGNCCDGVMAACYGNGVGARFNCCYCCWNCTVHVGLLFICVKVVCAILSQGVELPRVVEYIVVPLLKVQKLLQLAMEQTHR
jgi:hypothetical protein